MSSQTRSSHPRRFHLPRTLPWSALLLLAFALLPPPAHADWAQMGEPVPVERLIQNVSRYVTQHPKDARGHYTLGRLYSLAFAMGLRAVQVMTRDWRTEAPLPLPDFLPYRSIREKRGLEEGPPDAAALRHLAASIRHYRRATQLAPREALYWLGLGWMLEQGAPLAGQVAAPFLAPPRRAAEAAWRQQALTAYRRAFALDLDEDLRKDRRGPAEDTMISLEAGEGILRLLEGRARTAAEKAEVARVQDAVRRLETKPRAITPILFPLDGPRPLSALLAPGRTAAFDLAGDGRPARWPWVGPDTGLLVWDPEGSGRITSGRQLFGSVTWWIFWRDGYEALAALDNDGDGWLAGPELDGLAVWRDRDGSGRSEPGEVRPLTEIGVARVAVRPAGRSEGAPFHPGGIELRDGTSLPTYDWTPTSLLPGGSDEPDTAAGSRSP